MTKQEMASYLVSLLTLMEGQDTAGVHNRSQALGNEFNKYWDLFKAEVEQEKEDETRKRNHIEKRHEARDDYASGQSGSGGSNRESPFEPRAGVNIGFRGSSSHEPV